MAPGVQDGTAAGLIGIALFIIFLVILGLVTRHSDRRQDTALLHDWQEQLAAAQLPAWDGQTWDWPQDGLGDYFFGYDPQQDPQGYYGQPGGDEWADQVCEALKLQADAYIEAITEPQPVMAG
jgi:hypothetical protein